jgi:hypothetical protein
MPLTSSQQAELGYFRNYILANPAFQKIMSVGAKAQQNPSALAADVGNAVGALNSSPLGVTPSGDPAIDAIQHDIAALQSSSAFSTFRQSMTPILADPGFVSLLQMEPAQDAAAFIPAGTLINLQLNNDADPPLLDIVKAGLEIVGGVAAIVAAIALAPEVLVGAALVGTIAAIVGGVAALIIGVIDLAVALDCDHDGDPGDPDDAPGIEC